MDGNTSVPKIFQEVFIHWDGGTMQWVEDPTYAPGSVVVLKVTNPCTSAYSYLADISYNDFRLKQLCCQNDYCALLNWVFVDDIGDFDVTLYIYINGINVLSTSTPGSGYFPLQTGDEVYAIVEKATPSPATKGVLQIVSTNYNFYGETNMGDPDVQSAEFPAVCDDNVTIAGAQYVA